MKTKNNGQKTPTRVDSQEKQEEQFPGYPLYDPSEDITRQEERIDADIEDTNWLNNKTAPQVTGQQPPITDGIYNEDDDENLDDSAADPYAVTKDDLEALGSEELAGDDGDDDGLKHRITPIDFSGEDLDIPGNELDDEAEAVGSEDEENNSYSIGGDRHNDLEEDPS